MSHGFHGNPALSNPAGWGGEIQRKTSRTIAEPTQNEVPTNTGWGTELRDQSCGATPMLQNIGVPQGAIDANVQLQHPPAASTFAPGWPPSSHVHAITQGHPRAGPSSYAYTQPVAQVLPHNELGIPFQLVGQPTVFSQPPRPYAPAMVSLHPVAPPPLHQASALHPPSHPHPSRPHNTAPQTQIFGGAPSHGYPGDLLREQALQDAIRHLAQPRAAPDTSQADQANAGPRHTQEGVPEGNVGTADDESENDVRPSRNPRATRKKRDKRPNLEGAGTPNQGDSSEDDHTPARPSPPQPRPIPRWDQSVPCTIPAGRKSRATPRVQLARHIRKTLQVLLMRRTRTSPFPPLPADNIRYPTLGKYSIRFDQSENSIFNQIAANIATLQIRRDYPGRLSDHLIKEIPEMVTSHIRYLCRCYKSNLKADADALWAARLKRASANSRAHTLFESRLKIIDRFPNALGQHRALIVHLGIEGTSSDEEEPSPPDHRTYSVKRRVELSSKVKMLKNKLDLAYSIYYKGPGSKGSQMHRRQPSDKLSDRPFMIEGLPITCISREWLRTLSKPEREFYEFTPHKYDYSFPDELLRRREKSVDLEMDSTEGEDEDEDGDEGGGGGRDGEGEGDEDRVTNTTFPDSNMFDINNTISSAFNMFATSSTEAAPDVPLDFDWRGGGIRSQSNSAPARYLTGQFSINDPLYDWSNATSPAPDNRVSIPSSAYTHTSNIPPHTSPPHANCLHPSFPQVRAPLKLDPNSSIIFDCKIDTIFVNFDTVHNCKIKPILIDFNAVSSVLANLVCFHRHSLTVHTYLPIAWTVGNPVQCSPQKETPAWEKARPLFRPETPPSFQATPQRSNPHPNSETTQKRKTPPAPPHSPPKQRRRVTREVVRVESDSEISEYEGIKLYDTGYQSLEDIKAKVKAKPLSKSMASRRTKARGNKSPPKSQAIIEDEVEVEEDMDEEVSIVEDSFKVKEELVEEPVKEKKSQASAIWHNVDGSPWRRAEIQREGTLARRFQLRSLIECLAMFTSAPPPNYLPMRISRSPAGSLEEIRRA
ncbi:hypothetical protein FRC06_008872 [Ceratobasidium sp. 370]|nr:hypothetical protein FRC06_008872 [Ceratobasidium sp. 370]